MVERTAKFPAADTVKSPQYDVTVIDFVQKNQGCFIVVSDDSAFIAALRGALQKQLALVSSNILSIVPDPANILKALNSAEAGRQSPLIIMERRLAGQDMTATVKQLKAAFPRLLIIMLTMDVEKHRIMYFMRSERTTSSPSPYPCRQSLRSWPSR